MVGRCLSEIDPTYDEQRKVSAGGGLEPRTPRVKVKIVNGFAQFAEQSFVCDVWKYLQVFLRIANKEDGYRQCCKMET